MQIINKVLSEAKTSYNLTSIAPLGDILFIDIETTGFSAASSNLYLIGCAYYSDNDTFNCKQFLAETSLDEKKILEEFNSFVKVFKTLIHYNGNNFDIPYIQEKCKKYELDCPISEMDGVDLYKRIYPYKDFLRIPNLKQKTIEQFIGLDREDTYSGGDLIGVYKEYTQTKKPEDLVKLILHNENDISGMLEITSVLAYSDLFNKKLTVTKVNMERFTDLSGAPKTELIMKIHLPSTLPNSFTHMANDCFFKASGDEAILKVPVFDCELKYFYANYKDYYYLPDEDQALHKSVASFVDKDHRVQAKASTCYTKISGLFLPQYSATFEPFFKVAYNDPRYFLELTDDRKKDREFFSNYASHILTSIAHK